MVLSFDGCWFGCGCLICAYCVVEWFVEVLWALLLLLGCGGLAGSCMVGFGMVLVGYLVVVVVVWFVLLVDCVLIGFWDWRWFGGGMAFVGGFGVVWCFWVFGVCYAVFVWCFR